MKQTLQINAKKRFASWLFMVITMMLFGGGEAYAQQLTPEQLDDIKNEYPIFQNRYYKDYARDCLRHHNPQLGDTWSGRLKAYPVSVQRIDDFTNGVGYLKFDIANAKDDEQYFISDEGRKLVISLKFYDKDGKESLIAPHGIIQSISEDGLHFCYIQNPDKFTQDYGTFLTTKPGAPISGSSSGIEYPYKIKIGEVTMLSELQNVKAELKFDWKFDATDNTLTSLDEKITIKNVTDTDGKLSIGKNPINHNPFERKIPVDLRGVIKDADGDDYTLTAIEGDAFKDPSGLSGLEILYLPKTITSIGAEAFKGTGLKELHLEDEILMNDTYGTAFDELKDGKQSCNVFVPKSTVSQYYNDNSSTNTHTSWIGFHYIFEEGTDIDKATIPVEFEGQQELLNDLTITGFEPGKLPNRVKNDRKLWISITHKVPNKRLILKAYSYTNDTDYTNASSSVFSYGGSGYSYIDGLEMNGTITKLRIKVIDKASLKPINGDTGKDKDITITGDFEYKDGSGNTGSFNGTIEDVTLKSLTIESNSSLELDLKNVIVNGSVQPNTTIDKDATVTIKLSGENNLGNLENNGKLTFETGTDPKLTGTTITNNGTFIDNTGLVNKVEGAADLILTLEPSKDIEIASGSKTTLEAWATTKSGQTPSVEWKDIAGNQTKNILRSAPNPIISIQAGAGTYRCTASVSNQGKTVSTTLTGTIKVTEKDPEPITDESLKDKNQEITITSQSGYKNGEDVAGIFDGSIDGATVKSLTIDPSSSDNLNISLIGVTVKNGETSGNTTINQNVTITLSGPNNLGTLVNNGTLTFKAGDNPTPSLNGTTINNKGIFTDETGLVKEVLGDAYMKFTKQLNPTTSQLTGTETPIVLEVGVTGKDGESSDIFTYQWQKKNGESWVDITSNTDKKYKLSVSETEATTGEGTYRCLITRTNSDGKTTTLTSATIVTFTDPAPAPSTYYDIVLPEIEGVITNPGAGTYSVAENDSFTFTLTLADDYNQAKPIVKVNDKEIKPDNLGRYVIDYLYDNTEIKITGVEKNPAPVGIDGANGTTVKVWATNGTLHIFTPRTADIRIVDFSGSPVKTIKNANGDNQIKLPNGNYIVIIGNETFKIANM